MKSRKLGNSGLELSVIGFGAWEAGKGEEWGTPPPDETIVEAIRAGLGGGMDWIDTAEVYGDGMSEELVAWAVRGRRDDVRIASKVAPSPVGSGFRPDQVREACRKSLTRLQTDHLDLYQLHWPDETGVPVEDTWGAMGELVDEGLVGAIGVSNFDRPLMERCQEGRDVDSLQQEFSMLVLEDRELIRWCGQEGVGVLAYSPLGAGLLTGGITTSTSFEPSDWRPTEAPGLFGPGNIERSLAVADAVGAVARRLGISTGELALAWTIHQPGVTAAIAGSRNPAHAISNARASDLELDEAALLELEAILALGPGAERNELRT